MKKYKSKIETMIIGLAIPYVSDKICLRNILLLSSKTYHLIKKEVFKRVFHELDISIKQRGQIWSQILDTKSLSLNYKDILSIVDSEPNAIPKSILNLISLDVDRSFTNCKSVSHKAISNILRAYACYNLKIQYCQGMHLIVGFLYYIYQDEEIAFKVFVKIINNFDMTNLYINDIPMLKRDLFQLDRITYIYHPELIEHLRSEGFEASMYAAIWFITLFTHIFGNASEEHPPVVLFTIWDEFMIYGWKAIFKIGLLVLLEYEDKLIKLGFEQMVSLIGNMIIPTVFKSIEFNNKLKESMRKIKLTNSMINKLGQEYDETFLDVKKYIEGLSK